MNSIPDEAVQAACNAVTLGEDENGNPVHLSNEEARAALTAAIPFLVRVKALDDETMHKLREALRFSASRSVMSSADEQRILSAIEPAPSPRAQALEEAAQALEAWGDIYGDNAAKCVRALSSQPVADGWLPIESAPKDGKIDIWATDNDGKGRRVTDCYYDRICDEWRTSAPALRLHCVKARYVTHWRPLPTPPSGEVA